MKKKILFTLLVASLLFTSFSFAEVINNIVAVVNDEVITKKDLNKFFLPLKLQIKSRYSGEELEKNLKKAKQNLLQKMIQDKLLLAEAEKNNLTVSDKMVESKLRNIKKNFSSEEEFKKYLKQSNMKVSDLRERYKQQFLIDRLVAKKIKSNIKILPKEALEYYKQHKDQFKSLEKVKVRQIFIPKQTENGLKEIKDIKKLLNERASFKQIAKKHSQGTNADQGGLLGVREKGELIHEIDKVIFSLKEGEISDIVETSMGYHIFKVEKKYPSSAKDFKQVRSMIKNILFQKKAQEKFQEYLKKLREDAYVSIKK